MSNTILTDDKITREALRILHQKANFLSTIHRDYDDSFANKGAKIGDTLRIRLPNKYTVRSGAVMQTQDVEEVNTTLAVTSQRGVDLNFDIKDLTLDIDDFNERILNPAVSALVANVESVVFTALYKKVYNMVDGDAATITFKHIMQGRQNLVDNLSAEGSQRTAMLSTSHTVDLVDALKGLFQDSQNIAKQNREGMMGRTAGFEFYENTHVGNHTTGTAVKTTTYLINGASQTGATMTIDTGSTTFLAGDVVTIAGVNRVHSETKVDSGVLQKFVVTADSGASATSLAISPSIVASGARQNVSGSPDNNAAVTKIGAAASELLTNTIVYEKAAFTLATADLLLPSGVDFASRQVFDGVSLCIVRDYDIVNHKMPCRMDVLFGQQATYAELACRIHADG